MPGTLRKKGDTLELSLAGCRGADFGDALEKVRAMPGRTYSGPPEKVWIVPATVANADRLLKTVRPDDPDKVGDWVRENMASAEESLTSPLPDDASLLLPWARKRLPHQPKIVNGDPFKGLFPAQRAAVDKMAREGRAILADDMGFGKTIEAIAAVEEWKLRNGGADGPKLVVCPASVKGGWRRELGRWLTDTDGNRAVVIEGSYAPKKGKTGAEVRREIIQQAIDNDDWIIVNWEQLRIEKTKVKTRNGGTKTVTAMKEPLFQETEWLAVIADEAHRAKNITAKQTKGLWRCRGEVMFALTGTPIMNSPDELWSLLRWLWPDEFHERGQAHAPGAVAYWPFYFDYVDFYEDHFRRKIITGVKNADALRFVLKEKLIRRTRPPGGRRRIFYDVPLNPGQQKLYDEAETSMWLAVADDVAAGNKEAIAFAQAAIQSGDTATLLRIPNGAARLVRLQQIIENAALVGGKDDSANMDDFEQKYADSRPFQWVVFCKFKDSCDLLAERLRNKYDARVGVYNGDVRPRDRVDLEEEFQRGEIDVMIGTIDAMYQGINLQTAHLQHWLSRSFVPAIDDQGECRCDREGQKNEVVVYVPEALATVATSKVAVISKLKQSIERTVLPKNHIQEDHV